MNKKEIIEQLKALQNEHEILEDLFGDTYKSNERIEALKFAIKCVESANDPVDPAWYFDRSRK